MTRVPDSPTTHGRVNAMAATDPDMQDHLARYTDTCSETGCTAERAIGETRCMPHHAGFQHVDAEGNEKRHRSDCGCGLCGEATARGHRPGSRVHHGSSVEPASLRVPMTGLAAVAWNAHLDAANLERYQRGALEAEIQRLQKQADDMDAGTEKRRMGVLRAVIQAQPVNAVWSDLLDVNAGPIHLEQDEDGTLVAVLTQAKPT